jgi:hypothetical protein
MNILSLCVGIISASFFILFFVGCHRDAKRRRPHRSWVTKISVHNEAVDSAQGRRYFIHLERQMADFLEHHRHALVAIVFLSLLPAVLRAQETPSTQQASVATKKVATPPAVAQELEAMRRRIGQLESGQLRRQFRTEDMHERQI